MATLILHAWRPQRRAASLRLASVVGVYVSVVTRADYAVAKCVSVRLSVCLSHASIVSKRLYTSSFLKLFHHRVATPF